MKKRQFIKTILGVAAIPFIAFKAKPKTSFAVMDEYHLARDPEFEDCVKSNPIILFNHPITITHGCLGE